MVVVFWVLMVLWLSFALAQSLPDLREGDWSTAAGCLLITVILLLIGWRVFG